MQKHLVIEEINRINYLMNFDLNKSIEDQNSLQISEQVLFEQAQPQQKLTPEQIKLAKQKIQANATKAAQTIFKELLRAFDLDGDKILTDNDGTNEGIALAAIKKIKNRETLDALNKIILSGKQYPNLKSWINAEMSDFDSEYGNIWGNLEKMGYDGANRNILLKIAGETGVGQLVKSADKAIDYLRSLTFEQIMEGFRDIVYGIGGAVATTILSIIPGGQAFNMLIYGALAAWDFVQIGKGKGKFFNTLIDTFSLLLSAMGLQESLKPLMATKATLGAETTAVGFFSKMAKSYPKLYQFFNSIVANISSGAKWVIDGITKGVKWLISKLTFLKSFGNMLLGALNRVSTFLGEIVNAIKNTAGKVLTSVSPKAALALKGGTEYLINYGKVKIGPILSALKLRLGQELYTKLDQKIVSWIEDKILVTGANTTTENIRPVICKAGKIYCDTFDIMMTTYVATRSSSGKEISTSVDKIRSAETGLEKTKQIISTAKSGTKATEKGSKFLGNEKEKTSS